MPQGSEHRRVEAGLDLDHAAYIREPHPNVLDLEQALRYESSDPESTYIGGAILAQLGIQAAQRSGLRHRLGLGRFHLTRVDPRTVHRSPETRRAIGRVGC